MQFLNLQLQRYKASIGLHLKTDFGVHNNRSDCHSSIGLSEVTPRAYCHALCHAPCAAAFIPLASGEGDAKSRNAVMTVAVRGDL